MNIHKEQHTETILQIHACKNEQKIYLESKSSCSVGQHPNGVHIDSKTSLKRKIVNIRKGPI